jgi:trans-aconitate 2-methyltransferase
MPPRDWDAATYERLAAPLTAMGTDVLDRLVLRGDETVLDAGCGTGNVTRVLLERLPRGRVIAVDAAPSMVEQARDLLPAAVDVRQADLLELELEEPVDAVLSTATFHWVPDHERLFERLHAALVPGGRLVAQCGGSGNVDEIKQAGFGAAADPRFAPYLAGWPGDWNFATPADTERRLRGAGFTDVWCWLTRVDVTPEDPAAYLRAICLGSFLARLPAELHEPFLAAALERLAEPLEIHYVRLNMLARRPDTGPDDGRRGDPRGPRRGP